MRSNAASAETVTVIVNRQPIRVEVGASVAVAVLNAQIACRTSVTGENRSPVCGMGTCFECRVTINGKMHQRGCQVPCREGMDIRCDG